MSRGVSEQIGQCVVASAGRRQHAPADRARACGASACRSADLDGEGRAVEWRRFRRCASDEARERLVVEAVSVCRRCSSTTRSTNSAARWKRSPRRSTSWFARSGSSRAARPGRCSAPATLDDGSFLATVERKLAAARAIVGECRSARAPSSTRRRPRSRRRCPTCRSAPRALPEIVGDVTIIGTNALLKSTRLGERGKGCSVIAQELRGHSGQIVAGINELPPTAERSHSLRRAGWRGRTQARRRTAGAPSTRA